MLTRQLSESLHAQTQTADAHFAGLRMDTLFPTFLHSASILCDSRRKSIAGQALAALLTGLVHRTGKGSSSSLPLLVPREPPTQTTSNTVAGSWTTLMVTQLFFLLSLWNRDATTHALSRRRMQIDANSHIPTQLHEDVLEFTRCHSNPLSLVQTYPTFNCIHSA